MNELVLFLHERYKFYADDKDERTYTFCTKVKEGVVPEYHLHPLVRLLKHLCHASGTAGPDETMQRSQLLNVA
jgi:hypothetical protein